MSNSSGAFARCGAKAIQASPLLPPLEVPPPTPELPPLLLISPLFPLPGCFGESSPCPLPLPCFVPSRECKAWAQPGPLKDALRGGPAAIFRKAVQGSPELRKACGLPRLWPCCQDTLIHLPCSFQKAQSWSWPEGVGPWGSVQLRAAPYLQILDSFVLYPSSPQEFALISVTEWEKQQGVDLQLGALSHP